MILFPRDSEHPPPVTRYVGEVGIEISIEDDGTIYMSMSAPMNQVRFKLALTPDQAEGYAALLSQAAAVARERGRLGGG